jgi:hypothetical protein
MVVAALVSNFSDIEEDYEDEEPNTVEEGIPILNLQQPIPNFQSIEK